MSNKILVLVLSLFLTSSLFAEELAPITNTPLHTKTTTPVVVPNQPIVLTIPFTFDETTSLELQVLQQKLLSYNNQQITLIDEGLGGDMFLVRDLGRAITLSKKQGNTITIDVVGIAASGNAYITCYADNIIMENGSSLLFHDAGGMVSLFLGFIQYRTTGRSESIIANMVDDSLLICKQKGVLTDQDIEIIQKGDDVIYLKSATSFIKQYAVDYGSFSNMGITVLFNALSDVILLLLLLSCVVFIIRKVGK